MSSACTFWTNAHIPLFYGGSKVKARPLAAHGAFPQEGDFFAVKFSGDLPAGLPCPIADPPLHSRSREPSSCENSSWSLFSSSSVGQTPQLNLSRIHLPPGLSARCLDQIPGALSLTLAEPSPPRALGQPGTTRGSRGVRVAMEGHGQARRAGHGAGSPQESVPAAGLSLPRLSSLGVVSGSLAWHHRQTRWRPGTCVYVLTWALVGRPWAGPGQVSRADDPEPSSVQRSPGIAEL